VREFPVAAGLRLGSALLLLLAPAIAAAEPMDLRDASPRRVAVRFEVSPADRPAELRRRFTPEIPAQLEPGDAAGLVRVRIDGRYVEQYLLPDHRASAGSFSDFVWTFDSETGEVRSATVSGVVLREIGFGLGTTDTWIDVRLDTARDVGFESRRFLGETYHRLCEAPEPPRCTVVQARRYDPASGYVNAVGGLEARSGRLRIHSFAPLGEAIFSEIGAAYDPVAAGASLTSGMP
jgi:hypothetical protein